jgi:hypothetical protein
LLKGFAALILMDCHTKNPVIVRIMPQHSRQIWTENENRITQLDDKLASSFLFSLMVLFLRLRSSSTPYLVLCTAGWKGFMSAAVIMDSAITRLLL